MIPTNPLPAEISRLNEDIADFCPVMVGNIIRSWEYAWCVQQAHLEDHHSALLADLGCGGFAGLSYYLSSLGHRVVAVDPSVAFPLHQHGHTDLAGGVHHHRGAASSIPAQEYDCIVSVSAIEHFSPAEHEWLIANLPRLVRPGGVFIATFDLYLNIALGSRCHLGLNIDGSELCHRLASEFVELTEPADPSPHLWRDRTDILSHVWDGVPLTVQGVVLKRKPNNRIFALMPLLNNPDTLPDWWSSQSRYYDEFVILDNSTDYQDTAPAIAARTALPVHVETIDVPEAMDPIRQKGLDIIREMATEGDWVALVHTDEHFTTHPRAFLRHVPSHEDCVYGASMLAFTPPEERSVADLSLAPSQWMSMVFFEHMEYRFVRWAPHLAWTSRGQGIGFEGWGHTPWIWRPPYIHYKHGTLREMVFMGAFNKPRGRATRWGLLDRFIQSEEDLWADMDVLIERHRQYKNGPYRLPSLGPWRLPECFCRV